jgi:hypothetical protein
VDDPVVNGQAWRQFCARLAEVGERILTDRFPTDDQGRIDGVRHLATQAAGWLNWAVGHADVDHPTFFRQNDLVMRWGGPNVDQTTRRARLQPDGIYRITGSMGACDDFILTLKNGDMHRERYGILEEVMGSELGFAAGDDVTINVSSAPPDGLDGPWVELPAGATMLNIREYYWDWQPAAPALFTIQRLDTLGRSPAPLDSPTLAGQLSEAIEQIESSIVYWNDYVERERAKLPTNSFGPPQGSAGGSSRIVYSFGFFDLGPDDALVIEADPAGARYWDVQLYSLGWFESLDFANRTTSLNHTQGRIGDDGRLRAVISAADPGVPNWLDNEGRNQGMCTFRWIQCLGDAVISAKVAPIGDVLASLPDGTPTVSHAARAIEIAGRQAHVAWRYRT